MQNTNRHRGRLKVAGFMALALAAALAGLTIYFGSPQLQAFFNAQPEADQTNYRRQQPPDLRKMAWNIFDKTYIVRPHLDSNFKVENGHYDLFRREQQTVNSDAARVYVQGAAMQEYSLACVSRGSVFSNRSAGKMVALTFDDGPFAKKTSQILQILQENDCRATFFTIGKYVHNNPELAQQVLAAGCELGSHSWFHTKQTGLSSEERAEDFARVAKAFNEAVGAPPYLFRAPYGAVNDEVKADIAAQNMISVLWSLDTEDWRAKSADAVYNSVLDVVRDGDIILMHENAEYTVEVLPRILAALKEQGYQVVTVSELIYAGSDIKAAADGQESE